MNKLSDNFLDELFRASFSNKRIVELVSDVLDYKYIQIPEYKHILRAIKSHYLDAHTVPSIGIIFQKFNGYTKIDESCTAVLERIGSTQFPIIEDLIRELELYIKDAKSLDYFNKFVELFNDGKTDEARRIMEEGGKYLNEFSIIKSGNQMKRVFADFPSRMSLRIDNPDMLVGDKIPFSIDELDAHTHGGVERKEAFCLLARSGVGKTKFLRHVSVGASRRGKTVLHIQGEGSEKACLDGYDSTWTAVLLQNIKRGEIDTEKYRALLKVAKQLRARGGEIYVKAFEQFDTASLRDVRAYALDLIKGFGGIDLIVFDYLEMFDPSNGIKYRASEERHRRLAIANGMVNMGVELDTVIGTATQATDVAPKLLEDPDFVMTRHNTSEAKSLVNPFQYFLTANQTSDEYEEGVMRLYAEKLREYKASNIFQIWQAYDYNRFYDRKKTLVNLGVYDQDIDR